MCAREESLKASFYNAAEKSSYIENLTSRFVAKLLLNLRNLIVTYVLKKKSFTTLVTCYSIV